MRTPVRVVAAGLLTGVLVGVAATVPAATPALAAAPDVWAFATSLNPTPAPGEVLEKTLQAGTFTTACPGQLATVTEPATGVYRVTLPCSASNRGIVHVTAIDPFGRYCAPARWVANGAAELVLVYCYGIGGTPDHAMFALLYTTSGGSAGPGWHAYVFASATGAINASYNSIGASNAVTRTAVGSYQVRLPNRSAIKYSGNLQATAVDAGHLGRHCKVSDWSSGDGLNLVQVGCFGVNGRPADSAFTLSFHDERAVSGGLAPPKSFAYQWTLSGAPAQSSFNSAGQVNGVQSNTIYFGGVAFPPTHLQITGYGSGPAYCEPSQPWQVDGTMLIAKDVLCWDAPGDGAQAAFFASIMSAA